MAKVVLVINNSWINVVIRLHCKRWIMRHCCDKASYSWKCTHIHHTKLKVKTHNKCKLIDTHSNVCHHCGTKKQYCFLFREPNFASWFNATLQKEKERWGKHLMTVALSIMISCCQWLKHTQYTKSKRDQNVGGALIALIIKPVTWKEKANKIVCCILVHSF